MDEAYRTMVNSVREFRLKYLDLSGEQPLDDVDQLAIELEKCKAALVKTRAKLSKKKTRIAELEAENEKQREQIEEFTSEFEHKKARADQLKRQSSDDHELPEDLLSNVESNEDSVITGNSVEPPSKKPKKKDKVTELDKSSGKKQKSKITTGPKQTNGLILYCMENRERLIQEGISKKDVTKELQSQWKALSKKEKKLYQNRAKQINAERFSEQK